MIAVPDIEGTMASDPIFWALKNEIKLRSGTTFTLDGCEYMADIMRDVARHRAVMKGTQARISTTFTVECIHSLRYKKYPQGIIYYFPTEKDVEKFSKTHFGPLIASNSCIKKHLKNDSVFIKKVGDTFLSFAGASATKILDGKKDSGAVRTTFADMIIRDERDLFDDDMAEMTFDRLQNSTFMREVDLGSPTMDDFGIHRVFLGSDQKFRMIKCRSCNKYTCIAIEFPASIKFKKEDSHSRPEPYYACIKCDGEIFPCDGEYVAKCPDNYNSRYPDEGISGYHVSHFITPNVKLSLVWQKWMEAQSNATRKGLFINRTLGLPFIDIEDRLRKQEVFKCCGDYPMASSSDSGTAMSADIMKTNRVLIAEKTKKGGAKIIYMARVTGFDALYDLVGRFNVRSAAVCLRPYEESFRTFQARCSNRKDNNGNPDKVTVFGVEYKDKQRNLLKTDEKSGIYSLARTEAMDGSQAWIRSGNFEIPRRCNEVEIFALECSNIAKRIEKNEKTGDRTYRYREIGSGGDHYRHCVNYLKLALLNLHDYQIEQGLQLLGAENDDYDWLHGGLR